VSEEWPEVTADQLRALRELRFVTVNTARNCMWGYDYDQARVAAVGFDCFGFERAPGLRDWQVTTGHPRIIEEVEKMLGLAHG
jgi:hypothetical protein